MPWSSSGIDLIRDGRRLASMKTNRRDDGQFGVLFTGAENTRFHLFVELRSDGHYKVGGILTDRGEKPERPARTRSSTEGKGGRLGRLRVRKGGQECDFVLTHDQSALTASKVPTLNPSTRATVQLPGKNSEETEFAVDYSFSKPVETDNAVSVRASTGEPEIWFSFRPIPTSTGTR